MVFLNPFFSHFKQHFKKMDLITINPELDILLTEIRGSRQDSATVLALPRTQELLRKPETYEVKINPTSKKIKCQRRACIGSV